ncbi:uncharacterized protein LOC118764025 [Octopus sinensis]|uniref:Uncharacterized protein LOC118764025 n=1 Tax=Octopus sinensis TaxID=2607531 RepID=A0A7E6EXN8_9MOLL|nr:uncharacterized protein LOC118764025 [Octopus sinensis]
MTMQLSLEDLHSIMEEIILLEDTRLRITVEGRPPTCFLCGKKGHMKARCPEKENEEEKKNEEGNTEEVVPIKETDRVEESVTVVNRRKRKEWVSSPPDSEKRLKEKETEEKRNRCEAPTEAVLKEGTQKETALQQMKRGSVYDVGYDVSACPDRSGWERKQTEVKRKRYKWHLVTYTKSIEIEKKIVKCKSVIRVRLPPGKYPEKAKGIVIDRESFEKLREMFGSYVDPLGVEVEFDELPPVMELDDLKHFMNI